MYKTYKFRLYPNNEQKIIMNKTFGCVRFTYNYFLDKCKKNNYIKAFDMCSEIKTLFKDYPFLKEVGIHLICLTYNISIQTLIILFSHCPYDVCITNQRHISHFLSFIHTSFCKTRLWKQIIMHFGIT